MRKYIAVISSIIFLVLFLLIGCDKEEKVPAYLSINSMSLTSNYLVVGTASHNIKDAWVYIDGQVLGVYELPARFPVLSEGRHSLNIAAGIFVDGVSATRTKYPFYNFYDTIIDFVAGQTLALPAPIPVKYFEGQTYTWYEDFEGTGFTFIANPSSDVQIIGTTDDVFEGTGSAKFTLTSDDPKFDGQMQDGYAIVTQNSTFLELNYKTEQPFSVGMRVSTGVSTKTVYVATVNTSAAWNKIYIDLSKVVNENQSADLFRVYIYAELSSGRSQSIVYLDNFKLIHN